MLRDSKSRHASKGRNSIRAFSKSKSIKSNLMLSKIAAEMFRMEVGLSAQSVSRVIDTSSLNRVRSNQH